MTTDQRQQRKQIALLIAVRESCEDVRDKMEAKQSRWLERRNLFMSRSCIKRIQRTSSRILILRNDPHDRSGGEAISAVWSGDARATRRWEVEGKSEE